MEVSVSPTAQPVSSGIISRHCCICYCNTNRYVTTPCNHKCCANCYMKINKCHMCRASLPQVFKLDIKICNITVPFYFCRGDINIDMILNKDKNTYDVYNILSQHNININSIKPEDITIDMNDIIIDKSLSLDAVNNEFSIMHVNPTKESKIGREILFKNVLTLIRLAIAVESDHDCLKPVQ